MHLLNVHRSFADCISQLNGRLFLAMQHNIHFLLEVLQNRKSDLLEWIIIILLSIENVISVYEIVKDSIGN